MTSKFKPIVKIKKQHMDKIESELIQARFEKQNIEKKIESLYADINSTVAPQNGTAAVMSLFRENLKLLRREKDDYEDALEFMENSIAKIQSEYKKAHMEYEKIKYLQEEELRVHLEKMKKKEQSDMDEIANMLFSSEKGI